MCYRAKYESEHLTKIPKPDPLSTVLYLIIFQFHFFYKFIIALVQIRLELNVKTCILNFHS